MSQEEYYHSRKDATPLFTAATELIAVSRLEFLADPHSADGFFLAAVGLLLRRLDAGDSVGPDAWLGLRRISRMLSEHGGKERHHEHFC